MQLNDVTQFVEANAELAHEATHDPLTGLANRRFLEEHLELAINRYRRHPDQQLAVLYLDLDGFKPVNDTFGHQAGDRVLRAIAARLRSACRSDEVVARIGGDEFVVATGEPEPVRERIERALAVPHCVVEGHDVVVPASTGIARIGHDDTPESLLDRADRAAYRDKRARKSARASADTTSTA